jgi:hypothetical protein
MALDTFVRWTGKGKRRPSKTEIRCALEDYVAGLAKEVSWTGDRFMVILWGAPSFAFQRVGPATPAQRQVWRELAAEGGLAAPDRRPRWFEVYLHKACIDVITREQDEVTNNVARGFAALCARDWIGKLEP